MTNPTPICSVDGIGNALPWKSEASSHYSVECFLFCIFFTKPNHYFGCEFRHWVFLSSRASSFCNHIFRVFWSCAVPKMSRINTLSVISVWAVMKNTFSWHYSIVKNPRQNMGIHGLFVPSINCSISCVGNQSSPKPAGFCLLNLCPKAFYDCWREALRFEEVCRNYIFRFIHTFFMFGFSGFPVQRTLANRVFIFTRSLGFVNA